MKQVMNPINSESGRFKDGNPQAGEYGTIVTAQFLNDVQDSLRNVQQEVISVLRAANITPNNKTVTQLLEAIHYLSISRIGEADGFKYIGKARSIVELRTIEPTHDKQHILLSGYYENTTNGNGVFISDFSDTSTEDDGATVVATPSGKRWKRVYASPAVGRVPNLETGYHEFTLSRTGPSLGNVVQSFCIDDQNGHIYSTHLSGDHQAYINRYNYKTHSTIKKADSYMACTTVLGHQGIAVEHQSNGNVKLWATPGATVPNQGRCAVRFSYVENANLTDYETFILFGEEFKAAGSVSLCVSHDQKYLIARGYLQSTSQSVIRIWDLSIFNQMGDYSEKYIYQFGIDMMSVTSADKYPLQGIACDGEVIVIQYGYYQHNVNKAILVYSLDGRLLSKNTSITIGKEKALADANGDHWEPEGIQFALNQQGNLALYHCINSGAAGHRVVRLYSSLPLTAEFKAINENVSAIFLNAGHDIGVPNGQALTISEEQEDDSFKPIATLQKGGAVFYLGENNFSIKRNATAGRDIVEFRINGTLSKGAGFNFYGASDSSTPNKAIITAGNGGAQLELTDSLAKFTKTVFAPLLTGQKVEIIFDDTSQAQMIVGNSLRKGYLQVSGSGNLGIWDNTLSRWMIASGTNGVVSLGYDPEDGSNSREVSTTKWVNQKLKPLRNDYSRTISGTSTFNNAQNQTIQVTGQTILYPNGKIEQFFYFKAFRISWFDYETANGSNSRANEIPVQLWTAMPNKITHVSSNLCRTTTGVTNAAEAMEWINPRWNYAKQGNLRDMCYLITGRRSGDTNEPVDLMIKVEGY